MKPVAFDYVRPASVEEACALLTASEDARVLAGGQSLIPMLAMRLARPSRLVDIARIPQLSGIREDDGVVTIGAAARQIVAERDQQHYRSHPAGEVYILRQAGLQLSHYNPIKASVVLPFLQRSGVVPSTSSSAVPLSSVDLAKRARSFTVFITCRTGENDVNTRAGEPASQAQGGIRTFRVDDSVSLGVLNMRAGPGLQHQVIVAVPAGSSGIKLGQCRPSDDGAAGAPWCEAQWREYAGWMSSCCLRPD